MATLSLCMIVKNEEQFLEQCLNSVKDWVDEIIIVDTGSTDRTKEIASRFTSKIFDFKWCNDFSAARNESLKHATKDWILVLDADETISNTERELMKKYIEEEKVSGYFLIQRNYTNNTAVLNFIRCPNNYKYNKNHGGWWDCFIIRLFRNDARIRFKGELHEVIDDSIKQLNGKILAADIIIHHYGEEKGAAAKKAKQEEYSLLAAKKVESETNSATAHFQFGVVLKQQGKFAEAEKELQEALGLKPELVVAQLDLAIVLQKQEKVEEAILAYHKVLEKKPDSPEAYFGLGFCYFQRKELEQAAHFFELAIKYHPLYLDAYVNLGAVYERMNLLDQAGEMLGKALHLDSHCARAYYNLGVVWEKADNLQKAIMCYEKGLELGYQKEGLKERINTLYRIIGSPPPPLKR
ncbi:MAG: glycosyltransferase [Nanoarchaeota archaeon]